MEGLLSGIESLLKDSIKDALVWDERGNGLVGKYVYVRHERDNIGFFLGYAMDNGAIKACIASVFFEPPISMWSDQVDFGRMSLYKIMIRTNLRLKANYFRMLTGRKFPSIIRTLLFKSHDAEIGSTSMRFFVESMSAIRQLQPSYKNVI